MRTWGTVLLSVINVGVAPAEGNDCVSNLVQVPLAQALQGILGKQVPN